RLPLEVLDGIGQIDMTGIEAGLSQHLPQQAASRPDETPALKVFPVSRPFADQEDLRPRRPFAKDRLRRALIEVAALALSGCLAKCREAGSLRQEIRRRDCCGCLAHLL